jgi:hypothetical protein
LLGASEKSKKIQDYLEQLSFYHLDYITTDFELKIKDSSGIECVLNSKKFEDFDSIQMSTMMIRA